MAGVSDSDIIKIGPFGKKNNSGVNFWDGKGQCNIVQIFVGHEMSISSIQYQYVDNGKLMLSELHGKSTANKFDVVNLNYPKEYITGIKGYINTIRDSIYSITFSTNFGEYGPFGKLPDLSKAPKFRQVMASEEFKEYSVNIGQNRQFFGFYGTTDKICGSLTSIGFYMKLKTDMDLVKKESLN